jgi:hypothetical protein
MSGKSSIDFNQKAYQATFYIILLSAVLMNMSGCATISGKQAQAPQDERRSKTANPADVRGAGVKALAGKWYKKQGGKYEDYAVYAENLGTFESYEITEDGRVKSEALTAVRSFDCIVETSAESEGTINFGADSQELNLSLNAGTVRRTNTCSAEKNSTDPTAATAANYRWRLSEDESGRAELCLTRTSGETACYRRQN